MKKWVCPVCGYVHEGDVPPEKCPQCGVPGSKFTEQKAEMTWAAEHVVGVGKVFGADVPADVQEQIIEGPVSYTHLDVYKRQPKGCAAAWNGSWCIRDRKGAVRSLPLRCRCPAQKRRRREGSVLPRRLRGSPPGPRSSG